MLAVLRDAGGDCADLRDAVDDEAFEPGSLVQETVYIWWPIAGAIAIVGAMLGAVVPGIKAVQQDVTEALSYE